MPGKAGEPLPLRHGGAPAESREDHGLAYLGDGELLSQEGRARHCRGNAGDHLVGDLQAPEPLYLLRYGAVKGGISRVEPRDEQPFSAAPFMIPTISSRVIWAES